MGRLNAWFLRIRQNHALEHATMCLLSRDDPQLHLAGRSDWNGFCLYGPVETQAVIKAVAEALSRLKRDERWLALHPRCGTNLAVTSALVGVAAFAAAASSARSFFGRLLRVLLAVVAAWIVAQPLGAAVQRECTTTANLDGVRVRLVRREIRGGVVVHRIVIARD